jgi:flagellar assembly factor FliW
MLDFETEAISDSPMANPDPIEGTASVAAPKSIMIETRYGTYEVEREKIVSFPKGLVGFADLREYAILNLPHEGTEQFKLLQSADEPGIGFYVVPVGLENSGLDPADVERAADQYQFALKDLAILLIVTARKAGNAVEMTANLRAPVLVDTEHCLAYQHVMADEKYPLRQKLN